jgi:hypothetical protein
LIYGDAGELFHRTAQETLSTAGMERLMGCLSELEKAHAKKICLYIPSLTPGCTGCLWS